MLHALNRVLPADAIVLEEAVTNRPAVLRQIVREPGGYYATGSPALGWAVAGAMGVKLARPQARSSRSAATARSTSACPPRPSGPRSGRARRSWRSS